VAPKLTVLFVNDGKSRIRLLRILHKTGSMTQRECALRFLPSITERCRGWDRARTSPWRDTTWEMEVVAADRKRQAVLAKSSLKARVNALDGGGDNPQFDQKAAVTVRYRQRIDPPLIAGAEPALEVRTPLIIGACQIGCGGQPSFVAFNRFSRNGLNNAYGAKEIFPHGLVGLSLQYPSVFLLRIAV
jgi:hypothetical protein